MKEKLNSFFNKLLEKEKQSIIIYKFSLEILYATLVYKLFNTVGFNVDFVLYKYILSWIPIVLSLKLIKQFFNKETFSNIIIILFYLFYFIPIFILYGLSNLSNLFFMISVVYMFILLLCNKYIKYIKFKKVGIKVSKLIFNILLVIVPIFVFLISYKYAGFRLTFKFIDVYDIRLEASKYDMPSLIKYIFGFINIVIPILFIYTLKYKKYFFSVLLLFTQFVVFSFSAQKSFIIAIFAVIVCYIFYKKKYIKYLPYILIIFVGLSFLEFAITKDSYIVLLLFRRIMFLPAQISQKYYFFFQSNPIDLFTNGIMSWLGFSPIYSESISTVMGNSFQLAQTSLNNGLIGDAFANLGYYGIILMPLILVITFRLFDAVSYNTKRKYTMGLTIFLAIKFINSFWSINLLSGGFLIAVILMYFFPSDEEDQKTKKYKKNDYFKLNDIFNALKNNWVKIIIINVVTIIISVIIGTSISSKTYKSNEYKSIVLADFQYNIESYNLYKNNKETLGLIVKEIGEFISYFELENLNEEYSNLVDNYSKLLIPETTEYNDEFFKNEKKVLEEYSNNMILSYDKVNIISKKLDSIDGVTVSYKVNHGYISDYNIYFESLYNKITFSVPLLIIFLLLVSNISFLYIKISKDLE